MTVYVLKHDYLIRSYHTPRLPGARMTPNLPAGTVVTIVAEGKQHALCVGQLKLSSEDM